MKISLCAITGNIGGEMMNRFLDNFEKVADEIIIVRAVGNQDPDDSLKTAHERGCVCQEYRNAKGNDWPHVDNFANARNMAWEMATGDWVMWADTDDIITDEAARALRATVEQSGDKFDMLITPYVVPDVGIRNPRERVVRRGIARWVQPVHECLEPIESENKWRTATCAEAEIVHNPGPRPAQARNGRNLRILLATPESEMTTSLRYHLFAEHFANGNMIEGAKAAEAFLQLPDAGPVERFECALSMSMISENANDKAAWLQLCVSECPDRREPYVLLSNIMQNAGDTKRAAAYLRCAESQPMPEIQPWNIRRKMWGWQFINEKARVARAEGRFAHADAIELNHFILNDGKISLLHATRGRPQQALEMRNLWLERAENPDAIEHIFGCDPDDETGPMLAGFRHIVQDEGGGPCGAWNMAASIATGEVLIQLSDDMIPPMGWDRLILEKLGDTSQPAVLRVSDGHRGDGLIVLAIATKAFVRQQGYLFHPAFFSMYSDNWLTECAQKTGVIVEAPEIVFEHRHPIFTGEDWHPTTAASNAPERYAEGLKVLDQLRTASDNRTGPDKVVIMAHEASLGYAINTIRPGWMRIGEVSIDTPSNEENAHSGAGVNSRFIRILREALADESWQNLWVAEYDTVCLSSRRETPPLRGMLTVRWKLIASGKIIAALSPWCMDRACVMAMIEAADKVPTGDGDEALLDRWICRVAKAAGVIIAPLENAHSHPPEDLPQAIADGCKFLHPIKNDEQYNALLK
jgi:glycosyltransferase involved in cell wall biosynthesis